MAQLSQHSVETAAAAAGLDADAPVRFVEVTGSTNTDLWRLAEDGAPEWGLVVAGRQEAGRGRLGRTWLSTPGTSLYLSVLLRPETPPSDASLIAIAAGLSGVSTCRAEGGVSGVGCKWPNDLVVGERKLGGVLAEANVERGRMAFVVVGTGINVSQRREDFPPELRETATSIAAEGGRPDTAEILRAYLWWMRTLYGTGGRGIRERVLEPYRRICTTIGRRVRATTTDGRRVEGVAVAIGDDAELIVEAGGEVARIGFGEVEHLR